MKIEDALLNERQAMEFLKLSYNAPHPLIASYKITIAALEKQIPKKRIKDFGWRCPNCNRHYVSNKAEKYCPECGQRLR